MRLTVVQVAALRKLAGAGEVGDSAYGLQVSRATLDALWRRGLAKAHAPVGSLFFPRSTIGYRITDKGRAELNAADAKRSEPGSG